MFFIFPHSLGKQYKFVSYQSFCSLKYSFTGYGWTRKLLSFAHKSHWSRLDQDESLEPDECYLTVICLQNARTGVNLCFSRAPSPKRCFRGQEQEQELGLWALWTSAPSLERIKVHILHLVHVHVKSVLICRFPLLLPILSLPFICGRNL